MTIADVRATRIQIPTTLARYPDPTGYWKLLDMVLVEVTTEDGLTGIGEAFGYVIPNATVSVVNDTLRPMLVGQDEANIRGLTEMLYFRTQIAGRYGITTFGISGVEIALWDLAGKRAGLPLYELLGGAATTQVPAYASLVRHPDRSERITQEAADAVAQGYTMVKIHQSDVDSVAMAREAMGPEVPLTVDVNCRWTTLESIRMAVAMAEYDLLWLEEPVWPPEDFEALHQIQSASGVPTSSGENACTAYQFKRMLDAEAVTYVQPSITKVGGVGDFLQICQMASLYNVEVAPHSPYFGPGFVATLHLIAHTGQARWVERFFFELEATPFRNPPAFAGATYTVPDGPGLGVALDPDVVAAYRVAD